MAEYIPRGDVYIHTRRRRRNTTERFVEGPKSYPPIRWPRKRIPITAARREKRVTDWLASLDAFAHIVQTNSIYVTEVQFPRCSADSLIASVSEWDPTTMSATSPPLSPASSGFSLKARKLVGGGPIPISDTPSAYPILGNFQPLRTLAATLAAVCPRWLVSF